MKLFIAAGLFLSASAIGAQPVDVAVGDWSRLPPYQQRNQLMPSRSVIDSIEQVAEAGSCNVVGLTRHGIELDVPVAIQFDARGAVNRVIVRDLRCPPLETVIGAAVVQMGRGGEFRPTRGPGWHRGSFGLTIE